MSRLKGFSDVSCYDLKNATDRWPLTLLMAIMSIWTYLGKFRVQTTWGYNTFSVLPKPAAVCFVTGQPLGYYSSWPLFTLSHHIYGSVVGSGAALSRSPVSGLCCIRLGDDIVIAGCF